MKQFYTSNYARKGSDPLAVAISARPPPWFRGLCYYQLAPTWEMIKGVKSGDWSETDYVREYLKKLKTVDPLAVVNDLPDGSLLLCYEPDDGSFCHRHIVAVWIEQTTGILVKEWRPIPPKTAADDLLVF